MRIKLYIEKLENELWRDASRAFCLWLGQEIELTNFGVVETNSIYSKENDVELFGFDLKEDYLIYVPKFKVWARSQSRLHGEADGDEVVLTNGEIIRLEPEPDVIPPEWLKQ